MNCNLCGHTMHDHLFNNDVIRQHLALVPTEKRLAELRGLLDYYSREFPYLGYNLSPDYPGMIEQEIRRVNALEVITPREDPPQRLAGHREHPHTKQGADQPLVDQR